MEKFAISQAPRKYDFLFVGMGAANCLLLLRLHESGLLSDRTVAIVEPSSKSTNDRTFCFWATQAEVSKLGLTNLISYSWDTIAIGSIVKEKINPLHYHHVKGIDLYNKTKDTLRDSDIVFYRSHLMDVPEVKSGYYEIRLEDEFLQAEKVFDSRPPSFKKPKGNQSHLLQSFYGWKIKADKKAFDTSFMVMMDFNVPQNDSTQFMYVLPFNEETALVELTRFGEKVVEKEEAELILRAYIEKLDVSYEILEFEQAVIPMSSAEMIVEDYGKNWINMGARGNMLKSSTGYAFHSMAQDALFQSEAIKNNPSSIRKSRKKRFALYDRLLLKILEEKPEYGKPIFETLFRKVSVTRVLSFLQERTSISEEIVIFSKLPKRLFIKTALRDLIQLIPSLPVLVLPFVFTICALAFSKSNLEYISLGVIAVGFLSVGLSHGALDHLTSKKINNTKQLALFALKYIFKGAVLGLVWLIFPDLALVIFIAYSAWHFGQADFKEWRLSQGWQSFLWGATVLLLILFFHFEELKLILQQIPNIRVVIVLEKITESQLASIQILIALSGLLLAFINKSRYLLFTLMYLLLTAMLPLLVSFGIYFVGQHSIHGWRHLQKGLNEKSSSLWLKSLPFSIGGALIILSIPFVAGSNYLGVFFILLSCLSIPHVFSMNHFYSKTE